MYVSITQTMYSWHFGSTYVNLPTRALIKLKIKNGIALCAADCTKTEQNNQIIIIHQETQ